MISLHTSKTKPVNFIKNKKNFYNFLKNSIKFNTENVQSVFDNENAPLLLKKVAKDYLNKNESIIISVIFHVDFTYEETFAWFLEDYEICA